MMNLNKKTLYFIAVGTFITIAGFLYVAFFAPQRPSPYTFTFYAETLPVLEDLVEEVEESQPIEQAEVIETPVYAIIFISGEVYQPGVFQLYHGSRVIDAVELAGGVTAYADLNRINLAAFVVDEQHIIVPSFYDEIEIYNVAEAVTSSNFSSNLININTADAATLQTLPGIGPVISQNIINHRNEQGPFTSIEQIRNVSRIGPNIFSSIQSLITIE